VGQAQQAAASAWGAVCRAADYRVVHWFLMRAWAVISAAAATCALARVQVLSAVGM